VSKRERLGSVAAFGVLAGAIFLVGRKPRRGASVRPTEPKAERTGRARPVAVPKPLSSESPPKWKTGTMKGTIWPQKTWHIAGISGPHILTLDCGRFGRGPMHAILDGIRVLTFPKPSRRQPFVLTSAGLVDGREVLICADTRDRGDLVGCDVFVDGFSLHNGAPVDSLSDRRAATEAVIAAYVPPGEAGRIANLFITTAAAMVIPFSVRGFTYRLTDHNPAQVWSWFGVYSIAALMVLFVGYRSLRRLPSGGWRRRLAATGVVLGCSAGIGALMLLILAFGPLAEVSRT